MPISNIEAQAEYFTNIPIIDRKFKSCVHLENEEDELFWNTMLQKHRPGEYYYIYYSKNDNGNDTRGCAQCLKYKGLLSKNFFICIDSDLRYLRGENGIDATHFILQTYCYSWENHYCYADRLQQAFANKSPQAVRQFNYTLFLSAYSSAIYEIFLMFLALDRKGIKGFSGKDLCQLLPQQCNSNQLTDNGASLIHSMKEEISKCLTSLKAEHGIDLEAEKTYYERLGLKEENAYLHIRGHHLYNLIRNIGRQLCRKENINFENEILFDKTPTQGYWEIECVGKDIALL